MTRSDLVARIAAEFPHLGDKGARRVVSAILNRIEAGMAEGRRTELRDFGVFTPIALPQRRTRNPQTGEAVTSSPAAMVRFRMGKQMRDRLNRSQP